MLLATTDTNAALENEFENERPTPHLVITTEDQGEWGEWENSGTDESTSEDRKEMKRKLDWPTTDKTEVDAANVNRRSADVLSGFSGKNMINPGNDAVQDELSDFIDATAAPAEKPGSSYDFAGGATLVGTKDTVILSATTTTGTTVPFRITVGNDNIDSYYLHELGHVMGAQHPKDHPDIRRGTEGVMCKGSCFFPNSLNVDPSDTIIGSKEFSDTNHDRILNNDED